MEYQEPKLVDREEEEEEEEVGLRRRQTGHLTSNNNGTAAFALISDNGHADGNGSVSEHVMADKSVYFDQGQGMWKCRHCKWTYGGQCPWTVHCQNLKEHSYTVMNVKNLNQQGPNFIFETKGTKSTDELLNTEVTDVKHSAFKKSTNDLTDDFEIQESRISETNHQNGKNLGVDIRSGPSPSTIVEPFKEQDIGSTSLIGETGVAADVDFADEIDQEGDDYDIERVIEKQNTHDLYCPNCHSCITRKVILRRRKLKIRGRKPKRDATQTVPEADDHDHVPQPDIFSCLSCFSIFIPTVNGFKLFRCFGNNNEDENVTDLQKAPSASTYWLYSIFASVKRTAAEDLGKAPVNITQLDRTVEDNSSLLRSHGNDHPISPISDGDSANKGEVAEEFPNKPLQQVDAGTAPMEVSVPNTIQQLSSKNVTDNMLSQKEKGGSVISDIETGTIQPEAHLTTNVPVESEILPQGEVKGRHARQWEILKSIIYGGLVELITSLAVVSSAAAAGSATLNILVLGLANLIGGLPIIFHNLRELKKEPSSEAPGERNQQEDRYLELLGQRENFAFHATVAILSFLIFGLLPPVLYGFSFRESDNRDYKLAAVGIAGLVCIGLLAIAKVYVQKPPKSYIKTVTYYLSVGIASSGAAFLAGELIEKVLEMLETSAPVSNAPLVKMRPTELPWASY